MESQKLASGLAGKSFPQTLQLITGVFSPKSVLRHVLANSQE